MRVGELQTTIKKIERRIYKKFCIKKREKRKREREKYRKKNYLTITVRKILGVNIKKI